MKTLIEIIKEGISEKQSFIESVDFKDEIAESMVSFSNTNGGRIIIGVKNNGKVIGFNPITDIDIIKLISIENCFPPITYSGRIILDNYKRIFEIEIFEDKSKFYKTLNTSMKKNAFKRIGIKNILMTKLEEDVHLFSIKKVIKPEYFDDNEVMLMDFISKNGGCSLTKIHKSFSISITEIDFTLTRLIYWGIISMKFNGECYGFYCN